MSDEGMPKLSVEDACHIADLVWMESLDKLIPPDVTSPAARSRARVELARRALRRGSATAADLLEGRAPEVHELLRRRRKKG